MSGPGPMQRAYKAWKRKNPPEDGYWYCHYCGVPLTDDPDLLAMGVQKLTIDHKVNRKTSRLKHKLSNFLPCCSMDNVRKGSRSYENYCAEFYPHLLYNITFKEH